MKMDLFNESDKNFDKLSDFLFNLTKENSIERRIELYTQIMKTLSNCQILSNDFVKNMICKK